MSLNTCTSGSGGDASCVKALGEGACCYAIEVSAVTSSPTAAQTAAIDALKSTGFPVTKGAKMNACVPKTTWSKPIEDNADYKKSEDATGLTFKGYCDSASNLVASLAAATLIVSSF